MFKMSGHTDTVTGFRLSPDGSFVLSNAMDNTGRYRVTHINYNEQLNFTLCSNIKLNYSLSFYMGHPGYEMLTLSCKICL